MARHWLAGLLRAREAQEKAAQVRLAQAHIAAREARVRTRYHADRLDSLVAADAAASAPVFTAAAAALQAAAATHAAAVTASAQADRIMTEQLGGLTDAVIARRSVEELHEQHIDATRAAEARASRRDIDEIAARVHRGTAERGLG